MSFVHPTGDGSVLAVYVQPRASKNELVGIQGDELKLRLTSPPVEGAANKLCQAFVAKLLGVPRRDVVLIAGERSRHKRLLISGLNSEELRKQLTVLIK